MSLFLRYGSEVNRFLIQANLLTGVINLSVETIYASDGAAMSILAIYLIAICGFAWVFRARRLLAL